MIITQQIIVFILIILIFLLIEMLIGMIITIFVILRRRKRFLNNPFDIMIVKYNDSGVLQRIDNEIGRREFVKDKGMCIIACGKKWNSVKFNLGNQISDNNIVPNSNGSILMGFGRKTLIVGLKDGVFAALENSRVSEELTDKEGKFFETHKAFFEEFRKNHKISYDFTENPVSFSLNPIAQEQTKFVLETNVELQNYYLNDEIMEKANLLIKVGIWLIIIAVVGIAVCMIILFSQAGMMQHSLISNAQVIADDMRARAAYNLTQVARPLVPVPGST